MNVPGSSSLVGGSSSWTCFSEVMRRTTTGLLELFPQNYHEPYYRSYLSEDFSALATGCGLTHVRDVKAFVSKVMVFDKPAV